MRQLLEKSVDTSQIGVSCGAQTRVRLLLRSGADISADNHHHVTTLKLKVEKGCERMMQLLLENRAKIRKKRMGWIHGTALGGHLRVRESAAPGIGKKWSVNRQQR